MGWSIGSSHDEIRINCSPGYTSRMMAYKEAFAAAQSALKGNNPDIGDRLARVNQAQGKAFRNRDNVLEALLINDSSLVNNAFTWSKTLPNVEERDQCLRVCAQYMPKEGFNKCFNSIHSKEIQAIVASWPSSKAALMGLVILR